MRFDAATIARAPRDKFGSCAGRGSTFVSFQKGRPHLHSGQGGKVTRARALIGSALGTMRDSRSEKANGRSQPLNGRLRSHFLPLMRTAGELERRGNVSDSENIERVVQLLVIRPAIL